MSRYRRFGYLAELKDGFVLVKFVKEMKKKLASLISKPINTKKLVVSLQQKAMKSVWAKSLNIFTNKI